MKRIIEEEPSQNFNIIANRVGFTDAPSMTKIFKSVCGMTPTMYRNSLQKE
uniref:helix-turn-helix domain-containing protein n=1 Tax=Prevotella sp. TaxID=59823 RepID=UPI004028BC96